MLLGIFVDAFKMKLKKRLKELELLDKIFFFQTIAYREIPL